MTDDPTVTVTYPEASLEVTKTATVTDNNSNSKNDNGDIIVYTITVKNTGNQTLTNITLTDEGYVTGSSGQRILSGVATISGQPSGTSMRWKLALANNQSKIHGVSLSWA